MLKTLLLFSLKINFYQRDFTKTLTYFQASVMNNHPFNALI